MSSVLLKCKSTNVASVTRFCSGSNWELAYAIEENATAKFDGLQGSYELSVKTPLCSKELFVMT